ncbi:MAG: glycosyltransferase family 9 protein [Acidobacteria bacterium]|nr:glycosyltransferase family 9 protein [Acidobacteriota bacterium]
MLLLRRAVASLRTAGHTVGLLAPVAPGAALVGRGPADVGTLLPWDRADVASLLTAAGVPPGALRQQLATFDAAVAYTRNAAIPRSLAALVTRVVVHDPLPVAGHASDWLARPVTDFGASVVAPPCQAPTREEDSAARPWLDGLPEEFLAVHAGSGSAPKNWPERRFAALVEALSGGRPWLLIEGPAETAGGPLRELPRAVLARELPPRVLGAVLARAGAYVGNDSGVSHLAAAWGAPTVALFGPTDPEVWAPVGPRVRVLRASSGRIQDLAVDDVLVLLSAPKAGEC